MKIQTTLYDQYGNKIKFLFKRCNDEWVTQHQDLAFPLLKLTQSERLYRAKIIDIHTFRKAKITPCETLPYFSEVQLFEYFGNSDLWAKGYWDKLNQWFYVAHYIANYRTNDPDNVERFTYSVERLGINRPYYVSYSTMNWSGLPRIMVFKNNNGNTVIDPSLSIAISAEPFIIQNLGIELTENELALLIDWVRLHYEKLLKLWYSKNEIIYFDDYMFTTF